MTILERLDNWKRDGVVSAEQKTILAGLAQGQPFSVFVELNVLLYAGVLAFVTGLGWTVSTWSHQIGDVLILLTLSALFAGALWFCFSQASAWAPAEVPAPNLLFDYVLYLGALSWSIELAYAESRFHLLSGRGDWYLFCTAALFFFLAYRFDNRFVLSLALSSLAAWLGFTLSHVPGWGVSTYKNEAITFSALVMTAAVLLRNRGIKSHFFETYINIGANVLFWSLLAGVFSSDHRTLWFLALLTACTLSLAWGSIQRRFPFVAYAVVYGYVGLASLIAPALDDPATMLGFFVVTGVATVAALVFIAHRFARES